VTDTEQPDDCTYRCTWCGATVDLWTDIHCADGEIERVPLTTPNPNLRGTPMAHDAETLTTLHDALRTTLERLLAAPTPAPVDQVVSAVLDVLTDEAREQHAAQLMEETRLRSLDFANGAAMEIEPAHELALLWVAAARGLLGDAPNYAERELIEPPGLLWNHMDVGAAGQPDRYTFTIQRLAPGALTPHAARDRAEQERDAAREQVRALTAADPGPVAPAIDAKHVEGCLLESQCRCDPTVQCAAVLVDLDGDVWRCELVPHAGDGHDSGDWSWSGGRGVHYARPEGEAQEAGMG